MLEVPLSLAAEDDTGSPSHVVDLIMMRRRSMRR
jgi:hypothetical protein